jgi:hypothetical protein
MTQQPTEINTYLLCSRGGVRNDTFHACTQCSLCKNIARQKCQWSIIIRKYNILLKFHQQNSILGFLEDSNGFTFQNFTLFSISA